MKLSFVIPAYNEQDYIGACLQFIAAEVARTSYDVEIIVVNNASTDRTRAIASAFPGVTVVAEPHKGLTAARAAGFRAASGQLIANIDADTRLPRGWLTTVFTEFEKSEKLVAISGPMVYYDVSFITSAARWPFYGLAYTWYLLNKFVFRIGSLVQGGNFVVRRSALVAIGGYNTDFKFYGEDADMARRLFQVGDVVFTFRLPMSSSGRRLIVEGPCTTAYHYGLNYFSTLIFKRPFTTTARDIRSTKIEPTPTSTKGLMLLAGGVGLSIVVAAVVSGMRL